MAGYIKNIVFGLVLVMFLTLIPAGGVYAAPAGPVYDITIGSTNNNSASLGETKDDEEDILDKMNNFLSSYKGLIVGLYGMVIITCIIVLILQIARFPATADHPVSRKTAMNQILWAGAALAILGSIGIIVGFAYSVFGK